MNEFRLDTDPKIKSGFQIPENYFETFSEKIMLQIPKQEPKVISIFQKRKTWIEIVAAVLVLALMIPMYTSLFKNSTEVDEITLENYIIDQSNINQYDLVSLLESEDIENIKIETTIEAETLEAILATSGNLEQHIITD